MGNQTSRTGRAKEGRKDGGKRRGGKSASAVLPEETVGQLCAHAEHHKDQWTRTEILAWFGLAAGIAALIALGIAIHQVATEDRTTNTELKELLQAIRESFQTGGVAVIAAHGDPSGSPNSSDDGEVPS